MAQENIGSHHSTAKKKISSLSSVRNDWKNPMRAWHNIVYGLLIIRSKAEVQCMEIIQNVALRSRDSIVMNFSTNASLACIHILN
jgi:hypothetical protein